LTPGGDYAGTFTLTATAIATESSNGSTASTSTTLALTVTSVADAPELSVEDAAGSPYYVPLTIAAALTDLDGSETLAIRIVGLPNGATLSAGTRSGADWVLAREDLDNLYVTPPAGDNRDFTLTVTATSTDGASTASVTEPLAVRVAPNVSADQVMVVEGGTALVAATTLLANDVNTDSPTLNQVGYAENGVVSLADGLVTFTPSPGFVGTARFAYEAIDSGGMGSFATVTVTVVSQDDFIEGTQARNILSGFAGNDTLQGGSDDDTLDGGSGTDIVLFASGGGPVLVDLARGIVTGASGTDSLLSIEAAGGTDADDVLLGDGGANIFIPGGGADIVSGRGGTDTVSYAGMTGAITATLAATGVALVAAGDQVDALLEIRNIVGGAGSDLLIGDGDSNRLEGGLGNDYV
jgi:Ca2+-binding RTX toxin-like protein